MVNLSLECCNAFLPAVCPVFDQPVRTHVTPLLTDLLWLPTAAQIKFLLLMLAYRVTSGSAPSCLNSVMQGDPTLYHCAPLTNVIWYCHPYTQGSLCPECSDFLVQKQWNELLNAIIPDAFQNLLKTNLW